MTRSTSGAPRTRDPSWRCTQPSGCQHAGERVRRRRCRPSRRTARADRVAAADEDVPGVQVVVVEARGAAGASAEPLAPRRRRWSRRAPELRVASLGRPRRRGARRTRRAASSASSKRAGHRSRGACRRGRARASRRPAGRARAGAGRTAGSTRHERVDEVIPGARARRGAGPPSGKHDPACARARWRSARARKPGRRLTASRAVEPDLERGPGAGRLEPDRPVDAWVGDERDQRELLAVARVVGRLAPSSSAGEHSNVDRDRQG